MKILNLTQHKATKEQIEAGVVDVNKEHERMLSDLLSFGDCPTMDDIDRRAKFILRMVLDYDVKTVMIGGPGYLMSRLEDYFYSVKINVYYSFTKRLSVEELDADGNVLKLSTFKHIGFVKVIEFNKNDGSIV